jgi:hypothetical protein
MKKIIRAISISALCSLAVVGCGTGGSNQPGNVLAVNATPFTTGELYMYLSEQTQVRGDGGVYYSEYGTQVTLANGERAEGHWASFDGGKLCRVVDGKEDSCEIYYHNDDVVSIVVDGNTESAPELLAGNKIDYLESGADKKMYTKEETTALVSGKTHMWENNNGAYYSPDGKLYTIWDGAMESGKWSVNDKGALCWHVPSWGSGPCESFYMGPEGLMSVYKGKEGPADELQEGNVKSL